MINTEWLGGARGIPSIARPPSFELFEIPHLNWDTGVPLVDLRRHDDFLVFGVIDQIPYYWLALTVVIIVLSADMLIKNSRVGRAWEATREDEDAAELMGVPTFKFKLLAFAMGAFVGGLAGGLFAGRQGFISPQSFLLLLSILFVAAVVVGGQGNRWGVMMGAASSPTCPSGSGGSRSGGCCVFGIVLMLLGDLPPARAPAAAAHGPGAEADGGHEHRGASRGAGDAEDEGSPSEPTPAATRRVVLEVDARITLQVRLVSPRWTTVSRFDIIDAGRDPRADRPERRRQDHLLQRHDRRLQADVAAGALPGQPLTGLKRHQITKLGIARTFQNIRLFKAMTALENVMVGADARHTTGMLSALFRLPRHRREEAAGRRAGAGAAATSWASRSQADELAANLSYGDQRRLEIARAMATEPTLLCLDEPAAGFNPAEKRQADGPDPQSPRPGLHRAADRARHAAGHGCHRPDRGAGVRPQDRRGRAGGDPEQPGGDRGLPRCRGPEAMSSEEGAS